MRIEMNNIYDYKYTPSPKIAEELAERIQKAMPRTSVTCNGNNIVIEGSTLNEGLVHIMQKFPYLDYITFCGKKFECNGWQKRIAEALDKYNNKIQQAL